MKKAQEMQAHLQEQMDGIQIEATAGGFDGELI